MKDITNSFVPSYDIICNDEDDEIWVQKPPQRGDHIRVQRMEGLYTHHGVYVSDREVIHFTGADDDSILDWDKPEVISTDLATFLKGGVLEVKEYTDEEFTDLYSPEQVVSYARACLGDKGYNLIFNNCEHFANVCTLGRFRSNQVDRFFNAIDDVFSIMLLSGGYKKMGIFSGILSVVSKVPSAIGAIGSAIFGSNKSSSSSNGTRSTTTTTYEPDRVKAAELEVQKANIDKQTRIEEAQINAENQIRLSELEKERENIRNQARIQEIQINADNKIKIAEIEKKTAQTHLREVQINTSNKIKIAKVERETAQVRLQEAQINADNNIQVSKIEKEKADIVAQAEIKKANINAENQIRLSELETERIELRKQAQKEIIRENADAQIAIEEARAKGFTVMAQTILTLQEKLNEVAEKRLRIIEKASLPIVKEMELFYGELNHKINEDNELYTSKKLPMLLETLSKFPESSPAYQLYFKQIETDMANQSKHYLQQLDNVAERQKMVLNSFLKGKEQIIGQTEALTKVMLENLSQKAQLASVSGQLSNFTAPKQLNTDKKPALENK